MQYNYYFPFLFFIPQGTLAIQKHFVDGGKDSQVIYTRLQVSAPRDVSHRRMVCQTEELLPSGPKQILKEEGML